MPIKIEKLKTSDLAQYKALIDECFGSSNSLNEYQKYSESDDSYTILVAKDGDKVVGSTTYYKIDLFTFSFQPVLEVFNVAVLGSHRGQKIAKKLLAQVIEYAKDNDYKSINLTCLDTAHDAHRLYESVGFEKASSVKYNLHLAN
ncbi:MAG: GNAT family N-acetyltransferase [Pseudomonadales bacterium]|jgi:predicted N-acetyltransferase YhbS|nr:GNAT family N-acetyltransferase [Pseudomonadales bacterium]